MDLSYVTERIIALWFPATCSAQVFRRGHRQASHMLINKHGDNYKVSCYHVNGAGSIINYVVF